MKKKEIQELKEKSEKYSKSAGINLNHDKTIVNRIISGLLKNKEKYGETYCPCRIVSGNKEKDKEIICPCIFHLEEIKKQGYCHCNLFVK